jgi:hypothetical protein
MFVNYFDGITICRQQQQPEERQLPSGSFQPRTKQFSWQKSAVQSFKGKHVGPAQVISTHNR